MDSNRKYQEQEQEKEDLRGKIQREIHRYRVRKLLAEEEFADVSRYRDKCDMYSDERYKCNERLKQIRDEIDFCKRQITAYVNGDDKAKIIPDKCL